MKIMWFVRAIIFHILLLGSIFVIYFRSPVITGLKPLPPIPLEAPAKRLVLFVTDGLRAQSFFHNNCANVPKIRQLIMEKGGILGISHTRVPTETRPGHIALIAGLYEDPSAVTRGWKENPIEFDTIFKRSYKTYAWGAHDVLHIFNKWSLQDTNAIQLFFDSYDHELDFSGSKKTLELDKWVFERVEKFLQRKYIVLQKEEKVYYFLHLLGLDSAGHIYKPQTESFLENLHYTDDGVFKMYKLFEKFFPDNRTTYVMTSDHGMTNSGSHGAGEVHETETPFFIWGAGINHTVNDTKKYILLNDKKQIPLHDIEQAQLCPLMTTVLGLPTPMNNFGILPEYFLNVSHEYLAQSMVCNAKQLLEQYVHLLKRHEEGYFSHLMPKYNELTWSVINGFKAYMKNLLEIHDYITVLKVSKILMLTTLNGINYYHVYYRNALLVATTLAMLSWLYYLITLLTRQQQQRKRKHSQQLKQLKTQRKYYIALFTLTLLVVIFCLLQHLPLQISFYLLLPLAVILLNINNSTFTLSYYYFVKQIPYSQIFISLLCTEILIIAFYNRQIISIGFLLYTYWCHRSTLLKKSSCVLFILTVILSCFPLLPTFVGYTNYSLWVIGACVTYIRPFVIKCQIPFQDKIIGGVCLINAFFCVYIHAKQLPLPLLCQFISWSYIMYVVFALIKKYQQKEHSKYQMLASKQNLEHVIYLLTVLYTLLCTSYESLFILLLLTQLTLSLNSMNSVTITNGKSNTSNNVETKSNYLLMHCFRLSLLIVLYMFFSIFGCGHMASVSSFDPNIIRCFLTVFSPFVIMFLVILKLILPTFLIVCCVIALIREFADMSQSFVEQLFICVLLICNVMDMNFLFLVRNTGSWLEIGMSISHFVIMQAATVILILFTYCSKAILLQTPKYLYKSSS